MGAFLTRINRNFPDYNSFDYGRIQTIVVYGIPLTITKSANGGTKSIFRMAEIRNYFEVSNLFFKIPLLVIFENKIRKIVF